MDSKKILFSQLKKIVGEENLIIDIDGLKVYQKDALAGYSGKPLAVAIPNSEQQICEVLKICKKYKVPIVTRGAGTGLSGGATPVENCIILSTAKLNKVISIDENQRIARVQPGVKNITISEKAAPYNLFYAPDPSSQIACSIGGNVAENSGGVHCLKYGLTLNNIFRLRAVNYKGEVFEVGLESFDSPGFDILALLVGSEGMLAVITEISVKLLPKPSFAKVISASFDDVEKAANAVAGIISEGVIPAGLEMMDQGMIKAVEEFVNAGYDTEAKAILLCESDGDIGEVEEEISIMRSILLGFGATKISISKTDEERNLFWAGRKNAFPASGRISPDYYCIDGTIPRKKLGEMLTKIKELEKKYKLTCNNVFHAGDGNLHPLILFDSAKKGDFTKTEKFGEEILKLCVEFGGTITGEHGVGLEKIDSMCVQFSNNERKAFISIKNSFDPLNILNPGKVIPSLSRCVEKGRVHVHKGKLNFPDIPSF